jgi:hypothetical protein
MPASPTSSELTELRSYLTPQEQDELDNHFTALLTAPEPLWRPYPGPQTRVLFPEHIVRFLSAWLRTTLRGQHCQLVLCFNPPATVEGRWLISFFAPWLDDKHPRPTLPGKLRYFATTRNGKEAERPNGERFLDQGEWIRPKSRTFIPARVQDNPALMGTDYLAQLLALEEPLRSQLAYGDMRAGMEDDPWQAIPTAWVEAAMARWTPEPPITEPRLSAIGVDVAAGLRLRPLVPRADRPSAGAGAAHRAGRPRRCHRLSVAVGRLRGA